MVEITLCRVSADSKKIDMIFSCSESDVLESLQITTYKLVDGDFELDSFDLSEVLKDDKTEYNMSILLESLNVSGPAMYRIVLTYSDGDDNPQIAEAFISDVNLVYRNIVDDLLSMGGNCSSISDEAIRKYLILYGHQAALYSEGGEDIAKMLFKILVKQFSNCSSNTRPGRCDVQFNNYIVKSNCGCKK